MADIRQRDGTPVPSDDTQEGALRRLYETEAGRTLLKVLVHPMVSRVAGALLEHPLSTVLIPPFIRKYDIRMEDYEARRFRSYNQFFTREAKAQARPVNHDPDVLISPCDAKLSVHPIREDSVFLIKDAPYRVEDLCGCKRLAERFRGGQCLIFRLCVDDYHRYCYVDHGTHGGNRFLGGELHTVNPISLGHYNIYKRNCRSVALLHTEHFGDIAQIEVGALLVGKIRNHYAHHRMRRGEEKGMFEFGGSTIVLLLQADAAELDADILRNNADGAETIVRFGEAIGHKPKTERSSS